MGNLIIDASELFGGNISNFFIPTEVKSDDTIIFTPGDICPIRTYKPVDENQKQESMLQHIRSAIRIQNSNLAISAITDAPCKTPNICKAPPEELLPCRHIQKFELKSSNLIDRLLNAIKALYVHSGYRDLWRTTIKNKNEKPTIGILCDPVTYFYIDTMLFYTLLYQININLIVYKTPDQRIRNKLYYTFITPDPTSDAFKHSHILNFGTVFYKPYEVIEKQDCYECITTRKYICNLPVMGLITLV